jgi:surface antigen
MYGSPNCARRCRRSDETELPIRAIPWYFGLLGRGGLVVRYSFGNFARGFIAMLVSGALLATPGQAQFRLPDITRNAVSDAQSSDGGCEEGKSKSVGSKVLGGLLGRTARNAASRTGVTRWVPISGFTDQLTESIACRLDPEEQAQAAEATLQATRSLEGAEGPQVGASATWMSNTRGEVSGRSTVVGRDADSAGLDCITVTDVIIVEGEETTADKRMCRPEGGGRYSIVA